jgi:hypothetical protein
MLQKRLKSAHRDVAALDELVAELFADRRPGSVSHPLRDHRVVLHLT